MTRSILIAASLLTCLIVSDPALAADAFQVCRGCHTDVKGRNGFGASLFGVVGRRAGSLPNFHYSDAMKASGIVWDAATLDRFITSPRDAVPGTRMPFGGIKDPAKRAQIIAYLKGLHD